MPATMVVLDASNAHWTDDQDGLVMQMPAVGGGTPVTIATVANASGYLAEDSTRVYWTVQGTSTNGFSDGAVWTASN